MVRWLLCALGAVVSEADMGRTLPGWPALPPAAIDVLRAHNPALVVREEGGIFLWAPPGQPGDSLLHEARLARQGISARLPIVDRSTSQRPIEVWMISEASTWDKLMPVLGAREQPSAASLNGRVFLFRPAGVDPADPTDLAHELVHLWLHVRHPKGLPLWMEEGAALSIGRDITAEYVAFRGRHANARPARDVLEWSLHEGQIDQLKAYPKELAARRAYYEQSMQAVDLLRRELGVDGFARFVDKTVQEGDWREALGNELPRGTLVRETLENLMPLRLMPENARAVP